MSSNPPINFFQTVSESLKPVTNFLQEQEQHNRTQRESLIATKMFNEFQGDMSQRLLDQSVNYDGSYDAHQVNMQTFDTLKSRTLSEIKDERIRNLVDSGLSNYKLQFERQSQVQGLKLEEELQATLKEQNDSYHLARINANPAEYESVMQEYAQQTATYRPDLRRAWQDEGISLRNRTYINAQYEAYKNAALSNEGLMSPAESLKTNVEALKAKVNSPDFYLTPEARNAANAFLDDKISTQLNAIQRTKQSLAEAKLKAINEAIEKGIPPPAPEGVDPNEYIESITLTAASGDPVKYKELSLNNLSSNLTGEVKARIEASGFQAAREETNSLVVLRDEARARGDEETFNTIDNEIAIRKGVEDEIMQKFHDNTADYWLNVSKGEIASGIKRAWLAPRELRPFGQRDYSQYISQTYQASYMMEQDKDNLKFLPPDEISVLRNQLDGLASKGDIDQFRAFANALYYEWSGKDDLAGGIDVYESVLDQLNESDKEGNVTSPRLGLALKQVLIDPENAGLIFTMLRNEGKDGNPLGFFKGIPQSDRSPEAFEKALDEAFKPYWKAFQTYPDFTKGNNPSENYRSLISEMAKNSESLPKYFAALGVKDMQGLAKQLVKMTVAKEFTIVSSAAANGPVAIPTTQVSDPVKEFIASRQMQTLYLKELARKNVTQSMAEKLGVGGVRPASDISTFNYQGAAGLLVSGSIDLSTIPQTGSKVFYRMEAIPITSKNSETGKVQTILIPTILDGKKVSKEEAVNRYGQTNDHLGVFTNESNALAFLENLHKYQSDVSMGRKIDPRQAEFGAPEKPKTSLFDLDKEGYLKNIQAYDTVNNRMRKLKIENLLTSGYFLPVERGSQYRLNAHFANEKIDYALIMEPLFDEMGKPVYYKINKRDIEMNIYPKFKHALVERDFNLIPWM